jgi:hypothetical protein
LKYKIQSFFIAILIFTGCFTSLAGCGNKEESIDFSYYNEMLSENENYNSNLFYLNSLDFQVADPSVIYISSGEQTGYFYAYGTSDDIQCHGFQSWRSTDMTHWESMGIAFKPNFSNTWATLNYWAPEVIFDEDDGLYYMFYNAQNLDKNNNQYLSVAYSENPQGPFVCADSRRDANGNMLYENKAVFDLTSENMAIDSETVRHQAIDASPFIDPVTKDKYLFFSYFDSFSQSEIFGMKMIDWFTPDYSTLTQLTAVGYLSLADRDNIDITKGSKVSEGPINEGPFMYYKDGTYYLTFSVFGYTDDKYQVRQALSDNPLGIFSKISVEDGGAVIYTDSMWDYMTSAGHHSFVKCGDELCIAYHTFYNRIDISNGRALAVDRVEFVKNNSGKEIMHTNGPTYSLQPLPETVSGYKDIAKSAVISSNNTTDGSNTKYLNDGLVKYHENDLTEEYQAKSGLTEITLSWDTFKTVRAVMIYNSIDYSKTYTRIEKIEFEYLSRTGGKTSTISCEKINYDWNLNADLSTEIMHPGGSAIVEFADLPVKSIKIYIKSPTDSEIALSEIMVLGKDSSMEPITDIQKYSYTNKEFGSPLLESKSLNFGTTETLKTGYGYDLSHDDGTDNAYITQNWCYDQYAYFNNIYSTKFYIEAEMTVIENDSYANDAYPKFGIAISCNQNTIFFYVDAVNFTNPVVGCAQRKLDNSDWNWTATEKLVTVSGIKYTDGNYIKLAIARDGDKFYMYVNGQLVIYYDNFSVFTKDTEAGTGFLTFNTGLKIKNYSATQDSEVVDYVIENTLI